MSIPDLLKEQPIETEVPYSVVRPVLSWVYIWMFFGLLATSVIAWTVAGNIEVFAQYLNRGTFLLLFIVQIGIAIGFGAALNRMSPSLATVLFMIYSAITGFVFSVIFLVYDLPSISGAFISTAALFAVMSVIGFTTQVDLTKLGGILIMGLIGLIIAMVVNLFLNSGVLGLIINIIGVIIFTGLAAFDTQKIKRLAYAAAQRGDEAAQTKVSVYGAFILYLDFINLFLFILRLTGRRQ
ncbi:MAG: Bax inhibitor-1/YccA family protein [Anaerolineae bacterium]|nr:Bax inhibitor-1/YccA family protein [Anaerolineae bacterium]